MDLFRKFKQFLRSCLVPEKRYCYFIAEAVKLQILSTDKNPSVDIRSLNAIPKFGVRGKMRHKKQICI